MHFQHRHWVFVYFSPTLVFTKLNYAAFWWHGHYISANLIIVHLISLKFNDGIGKIFVRKIVRIFVKMNEKPNRSRIKFCIWKSVYMLIRGDNRRNVFIDPIKYVMFDFNYVSSTFEMRFSICYHSIGNISICENCSAKMKTKKKKKPSLSNPPPWSMNYGVLLYYFHVFFSWRTIFKFSLAWGKLWSFLFKQNEKVF